MSCARLGLYVFCHRFLFEQCYELQPTFQLLLQRPDHLALNLNETTSFTDRHVADPGLVQLVSGVEEMSGIVNFKMHQVYQARVMGHQFDQFSAYSGQVAPSLGSKKASRIQHPNTSPWASICLPIHMMQMASCLLKANQRKLQKWKSLKTVRMGIYHQRTI
ncbi:hypothetical protein PVL29_017193 [Vitis rotundifolia]|uniref:Uncharacterized protein n=1 Tax=Vitis rotundifolia TaxID=103349 RepID=A0AA38ZAW1_VITRO|nr:hypothetical protein PVL29_017193 [Vitis rotundifolia]